LILVTSFRGRAFRRALFMLSGCAEERLGGYPVQERAQSAAHRFGEGTQFLGRVAIELLALGSTNVDVYNVRREPLRSRLEWPAGT
jgi:hypothetical protein